MYSILLAVIYAAFISLGLPDSLLGAAWPAMQPGMAVPVSAVGIVSMIISLGTVVSSLMSDRVNRRMGTGIVTAVSVLMTAVALMGFSLSGSFWQLCIWAVPYGLGAGGVDAALNNYVALHYSSRHMSWLHCFWGIGVSVGPYIMGQCLLHGFPWGSGYKIISVIQFLLAAVIFISLPLWTRVHGKETYLSDYKKDDNKSADKPVGLLHVMKIRGVPFVLISFCVYCALESATGLWASSFFAACRGIDTETAASLASLYYIGITAGRFACGFIADRVGDRMLVRIGLITVICGAGFIIIPVSSVVLACVGIVICGVGSAPVYPSVIHSTPDNFGAENSQAIIGVQMASAYVGTTFIPPLFGLISEKTGMFIYPFFIILLAIIVLISTENVGKAVEKES